MEARRGSGARKGAKVEQWRESLRAEKAGTWSLQRNATQLTPWFQASELQSCKRINLSHVKSLNLWRFAAAAIGNKYTNINISIIFLLVNISEIKCWLKNNNFQRSFLGLGKRFVTQITKSKLK